MSESGGNNRPANGWLRANIVMLILSVLVVIVGTGWTLIAIRRNALSATCLSQVLHRMFDEHVKTLVAKEPLPVAPTPRAKRPGVVLPEGMVIVTLPFNFSWCGGGVSPGSRVHVLATGRYEGKLRAFDLLIDRQVLAVDFLVSQARMAPGAVTVSLAVTTEEARLVGLANSRGCHLDMLLSLPHRRASCHFDMREVERLLDNISPVELRKEVLPTAPTPHVAGKK